MGRGISRWRSLTREAVAQQRWRGPVTVLAVTRAPDAGRRTARRFSCGGPGYARCDVTFAWMHALGRRYRRRVALVAVMLALGGAITVTHATGVDGHIADGMAICVAVLTVGTAALAASTRALGEQGGLKVAPDVLGRPLVLLARGDTLPRTRAGPAFLQVFLR